MFSRTTKRSSVAIIAALLVLALLGLYLRQQWLGPQLSGYEVTIQPLRQQVVASGTVSSQALARIGSEVTGVLKTRHVREGDIVNPGDVLLALHDDEQQARVREAEAALQDLITSTRPQAAAALLEAQNTQERTLRERARRETLYAQQQIAQEQLEQARSADVASSAALQRAQVQAAAVAAGGTQEQQLQQRLAAARAALEKTVIRSSVTGTVQSRNAEPGDLIQPGTTLLEIYSAMSREILVPVDEKSFGALALKQTAQVIADAYPNKILDATVNFLAPAVDVARGTVDVHLTLHDEASFLRQGMTVSVTIVTAQRDQALVLPNDALRNLQGNQAEVLRVRDNRVEAVAVTLGLRSMVASEVVAGLEAGDVVLSTTAEPGARVRVQTRFPGEN